MSPVIPDKFRLLLSLALLLSAASLTAAELRLTEGTNIAADVAANDGRIAMDLLGSVWIVPARGGDARRLIDPQWQASRPRWSPDGTAIMFESGASGRSLWRATLTDPAPERITPAGLSEQHGAWHPSGERITYVAARHDTGLDIWERDLATGLSWRLTDHPGDESEPAWSEDGRHLVYVLHENDRWYLMLRRFGQPAAILQDSATPLRAPAWRPDNTLITFLARNDYGEFALNMLIPSDPPLARTLIDREDFFLAPVSWLDRGRFVYTADGRIKTRQFAARESRTLPFSAAVGQQRDVALRVEQTRPLSEPAATGGDLVIRASRLFDGDSAGYREQVDVVIENGIITAIEPQRDRGDALLIDISNSVVMPGLIDAYAALPANADPALLALILASGVTTLVTPDLTGKQADSLGASQSTPGPRLLLAAVTGRTPVSDDRRVRLVTLGNESTQQDIAAQVANWRRLGVPLLVSNWNAGLVNGADMLLGTATLPVSPAGRRYRDVQGLTAGGPLLLVSGLADNNTPGLTHLQRPSQTAHLSLADNGARQAGPATEWLNGHSQVVAGSRPSGFPPGFATLAELLALKAAGLGPHATLAAATSAAADALGLGDDIGRVRVGARADLVLVAGDPLDDPADVAKPIAVVRNGRFYSTGSLLDEYVRLSVE